MKVQSVEDYLNSDTYKRREKNKIIRKERVKKEVNNILENEELNNTQERIIKSFLDEGVFAINPTWSNRVVAQELSKKGLLTWLKRGRGGHFALKNVKTDDLDFS